MENYYWYDRDVNKALDAYDRWHKHFLEVESHEIPEIIWQGVEQEFYAYAKVGREMIKNYHLFDSKQDHLDGNVRGVELSIRHPIRTPTGRNLDIEFGGTIDLLLVQGKNWWVVDHKTSGSKPSAAGISVDEQLTSYCYLIWRSTGVVPAGAVYNVLLRRALEEPRMLKSGQLSQDKTQRVVYENYVQAIKDNGLSLADYGDFLQFLSERGWSEFFIREGSVRNENELRAFEKRLYYKYTQMLQAIRFPDNLAYPEPSTWKCGYCQFQAACKSLCDGGDYQAQLESMFNSKIRKEETDDS